MAGGKGQNSEAPHGPPPPEHAVNVHGGDYHPVRDPDEREHDADMDLALVMFRGLTVVTCIAAILCVVVNAVSLARSIRWEFYVFIGILRGYTVIFAGFIAIAETEWEWLFRQWPYLEYWFGRGMLQIFVAVLTKALSGASYEVRFERIIHDVAAYMLLGCGVIYSVAGLLCFRKLKRRRIQRKQWREQAVKDLEELDRKRRELQGLLAAGA